ncbi:hypothetical protein FRB94_004504 [Tulasnella sp. JGI-2019a]|nr:hypothetical protein FRB94_004504 [Tulasnella sp. JGI-2019a]
MELESMGRTEAMEKEQEKTHSTSAPSGEGEAHDLPTSSESKRSQPLASPAPAAHPPNTILNPQHMPISPDGYGTITSPHIDPRPALEAQMSRGRSPSAQKRGKSPENQMNADDATASPGRQSEERERLPTFWSMLNPAPALENQGNVARDHLANERTWLAYVRTSLAIASAGVALVQLFSISMSSSPKSTEQLRHLIRPLGGTVVVVGLAVLVVGSWRYFLIQTALQRGQFPPARRTVGLLTAVLFAIVGVTFGFLVGVRRS